MRRSIAPPRRLALLAFLWVTPLSAQTPASSPAPSESVVQAVAAARAIFDEAGLPGLSLAIGVDGRIVHSEVFGEAVL